MVVDCVVRYHSIPMRDITSYPDQALHSTIQVADFLGRTPRAIRNLVRTKVLTPSDKRCTMYFSTAEIKRYLAKAKLFKDGLGVPSLQKGHTPHGRTDDDQADAGQPE